MFNTVLSLLHMSAATKTFLCVLRRAVIRRPMCGTCGQDNASSLLRPMTQTSTVSGKGFMRYVLCEIYIEVNI
jgi:hypothetical protein